MYEYITYWTDLNNGTYKNRESNQDPIPGKFLYVNGVKKSHVDLNKRQIREKYKEVFKWFLTDIAGGLSSEQWGDTPDVPSILYHFNAMIDAGDDYPELRDQINRMYEMQQDRKKSSEFK